MVTGMVIGSRWSQAQTKLYFKSIKPYHTLMISHRPAPWAVCNWISNLQPRSGPWARYSWGWILLWIKLRFVHTYYLLLLLYQSCNRLLSARVKSKAIWWEKNIFVRKKIDCFARQTKALIIFINSPDLDCRGNGRTRSIRHEIGNASVGLRHLHSLPQRLAPAASEAAIRSYIALANCCWMWVSYWIRWWVEKELIRNKSCRIKEEHPVEGVLKLEPILIGSFISAWWQQDWEVTLMYLIAYSE